MPLGIRPINDFVFKKTFGTPENRAALISLLNAILRPTPPIVDVTLENPFNLQDFEDDKLSVLDVKAVDAAGAIYDIEMQLEIFAGLVQRIVFYGCELYAGQLKAGDDYAALRPVYSICLINGVLWRDATQVHHAFRLTDGQSGRVLRGTLEIHTLELGRYTLREADLAAGDMLDCWLYWLLHAQEYEPAALLDECLAQLARQRFEAGRHDRGGRYGEARLSGCCGCPGSPGDSGGLRRDFPYRSFSQNGRSGLYGSLCAGGRGEGDRGGLHRFNAVRGCNRPG